MNNYEPKHGEWVRNYWDSGSILWAGVNKPTFIVLDVGRIHQFSPYLTSDRKPATHAQARSAEAVLRESEHCPDPWPGQVDELPASGLPGYWQDVGGDIWSYRNGDWHSWAERSGWSGGDIGQVDADFGPFLRISNPDPDNNEHFPTFNKAPTKEELQAEFERVSKQRDQLRSIVESMTKEQIIYALMNGE